METAIRPVPQVTGPNDVALRVRANAHLAAGC